MKTKLLITILLLLHAGMALYHLSHTTMWDDEASVVWFAKNYNKYGKILGYDGDNIFSYRNGQLINDQLIYNNPPLDIYFTSVVIENIGDSDFIVRLSFAIVGFLALMLFIYCFKLLTEGDKVWFNFSAALLILSVNYLLIEANARYYSLNFLFAALSLVATLKIGRQYEHKFIHRVGWLFLQLGSIYLLFMSHYLAAVCWWPVMFLLMLMHGQVDYRLRDRFTRSVVAANLVLLMVIADYIIVNNVMNRPDLSSTDSRMVRYHKLVVWLLFDLHRINVVPLAVFPVFLFLFVFLWKRLSAAFLRVVVCTLAFLLLILFLTPQSTTSSVNFEVRYLYIIIPMLYMVIAYPFKVVYEHSVAGKVVSVALALIFINSNLLVIYPLRTKPKWLLPAFVMERMKPYPTAYSEALKYIRTNFKERKKILTLPEFHNTVFLRYVPEKIEITNTLWPDSPLSRRVVDSLGMQCLYVGRCKPDYVFQFGTTDTLTAYPFLPADFRQIDTIEVFSLGLDISRPELFWHSFGPKPVTDINKEALYIYHD